MKIITYFILAMLLACGGVTATLWFQASHQSAKIEKQAEAIGTMQQQLDGAEATLKAVKDGVERSDRELVSLSSALSKVGEKRSVITERIYHLKETNDEIRDFLSVDLSDAGCLLDDTCQAPAHPGAAQTVTGTAAAVRPPIAVSGNQGSDAGAQQQRTASGF